MCALQLNGKTQCLSAQVSCSWSGNNPEAEVGFTIKTSTLSKIKCRNPGQHVETLPQQELTVSNRRISKLAEENKKVLLVYTMKNDDEWEQVC